MTPPEVTSSLALAYEKYEDAARDLEIVQRNNIANPLFVPKTELKVASE
jgi:prophage DNA circulation protein